VTARGEGEFYAGRGKHAREAEVSSRAVNRPPDPWVHHCGDVGRRDRAVRSEGAPHPKRL